MPSRFHDNLGLKIASEDDRHEWIALVTAISDRIDEAGMAEDILFHGTTIRQARSILRHGMRPTDAFEVLHDGEETMTQGSFWGTVRTAAWYAEDKSFHRGDRPALIACPVGFLQTYSTLGIDIPSRDFPVPGLTQLEDPGTAARWATGMTRTWQDSLSDIGSVTALHEEILPLDAALIMHGIESLERILENNVFSA
ncbi:hypothetical protein G6L37_01915 [Agrobacterium rubi]|nr:hypothetical protein [Agrobacterium rubi]NTF24149.1 hypothetical protein [Agrobacterium rubi]